MRPTIRVISHALALSALALTVAFCGMATAAEFENYKLTSVSGELSTTQAGAHPDFTTNFELATNSGGQIYAKTQGVEVTLPPGLLGNPQGIPRCTTVQLGTNPAQSECPFDAQVGTVDITLNPGAGSASVLSGAPLYNMVPPAGTVARLGFFASDFPVIIDVTVDPLDYGLTASIKGASAAVNLIGASTTLWGVPAAPIHDPERLTPLEANEGTGPPGGRESNLPETPFMTNPTSCGGPLEIGVTARSYPMPEAPSTMEGTLPPITGCGKLRFEPTLSVTPTNQEAAAPTGIDADLRMPQDETAKGLATSTLKAATVQLPPGLTINPAAGDGLAACSAEQVGFERDEAAHCPDAAKIGSAEIDVPALEHVLNGSVYQRTPEPGNLFRFWLVSDELGVHLKLPAEIKADPATGQLTTVFDGLPALGGNPEVPVSELKLHIFGGPRAPLSTPAGCGTYQTHFALSPWSGQSTVEGTTPMQITSGCGKGGFSPKLSAGTLDPFAGKFAAFTLELTRQDGEANPQTMEVTLPKGLLAKLGGVPLCSEAAAATGACSAASQIGTVSVAAGVGSAPLWIPQPGKSPTAVYLAGPYRGAPYSLVVMVPAQAGPFDLGTVVTRAGIYVDPESVVATIKTDPLPQILEGVPVAYRAIHVDVTRPEFTLNPTGCEPEQVSAAVTASNGATAHPSYGFQAANCAKLAFGPSLSLNLKGGTKRAKHPALSAVLNLPQGQSNIARAVVVLPPTEFIDQNHINNPCTRVQFSAEQCPPESLLGTATAVTPLLDQPLEGPVYFRSNGGERELPDIVADLHGAIHVVLVGFVDAKHRKGSEVSRVRTTFANVPDAPVSKFTMQLFGGKKGLLVNSADLCAATRRAEVTMKGQNGGTHDFNPVIRTSCPHGKK